MSVEVPLDSAVDELILFSSFKIVPFVFCFPLSIRLPMLSLVLPSDLPVPPAVLPVG